MTLESSKIINIGPDLPYWVSPRPRRYIGTSLEQTRSSATAEKLRRSIATHNDSEIVLKRWETVRETWACTLHLNQPNAVGPITLLF